ncbi:hypothetical protein 043JT007_82 [Bacillus phage 043JT007]|nr:hypothetical protein 043JT007_82 [Bacillus phage 043JT007]
MRSLRSRAILKSHGYIKRANGQYEKQEDCHWCEQDIIDTDCWLCQGTGRISDNIALDHFKEIIKDNGYHTTVAPCEHCGEITQIDYDYWCCNGDLCGCRGERISYAVCTSCNERIERGEIV